MLNDDQKAWHAVIAVLVEHVVTIAREKHIALPQELTDFFNFISEQFKPNDVVSPEKTTVEWANYNTRYEQARDICFRDLKTAENLGALSFLQALLDEAKQWSHGTYDTSKAKITVGDLFRQPCRADNINRIFATKVTDFYNKHKPGQSLPAAVTDPAATIDQTTEPNLTPADVEEGSLAPTTHSHQYLTSVRSNLEPAASRPAVAVANSNATVVDPEQPNAKATPAQVASAVSGALPATTASSSSAPEQQHQQQVNTTAGKEEFTYPTDADKLYYSLFLLLGRQLILDLERQLILDLSISDIVTSSELSTLKQDCDMARNYASYLSYPCPTATYNAYLENFQKQIEKHKLLREIAKLAKFLQETYETNEKLVVKETSVTLDVLRAGAAPPQVSTHFSGDMEKIIKEWLAKERFLIANTKTHLAVFKLLAQQTLKTAAERKVDLAEMGESLALCIQQIEGTLTLDCSNANVKELSLSIINIIRDYQSLDSQFGHQGFKFSGLLASLTFESGKWAASEEGFNAKSHKASLPALLDENNQAHVYQSAVEIFDEWQQLPQEVQLYTPLQQQAAIAIFQIEVNVAAHMRGSFFDNYIPEVKKWLGENFKDKLIKDLQSLFFENCIARDALINTIPQPLQYNFKNALRAVREGQYSCQSQGYFRERSFMIKQPRPQQGTSANENNRDSVYVNAILGTLALAFKEGYGKHSKAFAGMILTTTTELIAALNNDNAQARADLTTKIGSTCAEIEKALVTQTITYPTFCR